MHVQILKIVHITGIYDLYRLFLKNFYLFDDNTIKKIYTSRRFSDGALVLLPPAIYLCKRICKRIVFL